MLDFITPTEASPRFKFRPEKAAEAVDLIARARPGITQYFVGKILYLADRAHFLDWGRPVTFDRYVATKFGPVPSLVRNMLAAAAGVDAGMDGERLATAETYAEALHQRVRVELQVTPSGERQSVFPLPEAPPFVHLSGSDIEALNGVIDEHGGKSFGSLSDMTHKDDAWRIAWANRGERGACDIDMADWAPLAERDGVREQLREYAASAVG